MVERDRVVLPESLHVLTVKAGSLERQLDARERQRLAVGENVARREQVLEWLIIGVERSDRVVQQHSARTQQGEQRLCIEVDLRVAHVLGHADARDRVEGRSWQLAIVGHANINLIAETRLGHLLARERRLGR